VTYKVQQDKKNVSRSCWTSECPTPLLGVFLVYTA